MEQLRNSIDIGVLRVGFDAHHIYERWNEF